MTFGLDRKMRGKIREVISNEKSHKGLTELEPDFFDKAMKYLKILVQQWKGKERGRPDVERSYRKWVTGKENLQNIFIRRLRKILILSSQRIERGNEGEGAVGEGSTVNLLPIERWLYYGVIVLAKIARNRLISVESKEEFEEEIAALMRDSETDDLTNRILTTMVGCLGDTDPPPIGSFGAYSSSNSSDKEKGDEKEVDSSRIGSNGKGEEDNSFLEPYETYAGEEGDMEEGGSEIESDIEGSEKSTPENEESELGVGDIEEGPDLAIEVEREEKEVEGRASASVEEEGKKEQSPDEMLVRIIEDIAPFVCSDGNTYNLKKGEIVSFPYYWVKALVDSQKAERIE